ncbi:MAG: hypothetical protein HDP34_05115 [Clostridia bacterium]|nr:hypothetical protein [Clostridia bacterium]
MEEKKENYTREELIKILDRLAQNLAWIKINLERTDKRTKKYKEILKLAEINKKSFKDILSPVYWDHPITVIEIRLYLDTRQAETIEQAVALYNKDTKYKPNIV